LSGIAIWTLLVPLAAAADAPRGDVAPTEHPFLWVIEGETPSFLYGTVHLPDERVVTLPPVVSEAFAASDMFFTEIPMDADTQQKANLAFMLPAGRSLQDILPPALYTRADAYLKARGYSIVLFQQMKVYGLMAVLAVLDYLEDMLTQPPLDDMLYEDALKMGKEVGAVETLEEQIGVFEALTEKEQTRLLEETLDYLETYDENDAPPTEKMVQAYLEGNAERLTRLMYEYMDPSDPLGRKFMNLVLTERNQRMAERIDASLRREPDRVQFFAIGALHYPLEHGILAQLEDEGYTIRRLVSDDFDDLRHLLTERVGVLD
jgi:uncharacterized protein YbaP (TraB family)